MLTRTMTESSTDIPKLPRGAPFVLIALVALLAGAGMAGWLDRGAAIFFAMAADAWAYCF